MGTVSCSGMATAQDARGAWFEPRYGITPYGVNFFCEKMVYCVCDWTSFIEFYENKQ